MFLTRALTIAALALGVALVPASKASAQPFPLPELKVTPQIITQKVDATTYKVKLRVTAELTGIAKNTFETAWITIKKLEVKPFSLNFNVIFSMSGSIKYTGNTISASVTVRAGVGGAVVMKTLSASVNVQ
jgi:hypothetical protein